MKNELFRPCEAELVASDPLDLPRVLSDGLDATAHELALTPKVFILLLDLAKAGLERTQSRKPPVAEDQGRNGKQRCRDEQTGQQDE